MRERDDEDGALEERSSVDIDGSMDNTDHIVMTIDLDAKYILISTSHSHNTITMIQSTKHTHFSISFSLFMTYAKSC